VIDFINHSDSKWNNSHFCEYIEEKHYLCIIKIDDMIVTFEEEYLQNLYDTGKSGDKKHRYKPEIIHKYQICIRYLLGASNIEALFTINSLNYKVLKGDKAGISSIRVNKQYRIEFTVTEQGAESIVTVCNILELSNHYK
jgi:toxin HigB-1